MGDVVTVKAKDLYPNMLLPFQPPMALGPTQHVEDLYIQLTEINPAAGDIAFFTYGPPSGGQTLSPSVHTNYFPQSLIKSVSRNGVKIA